MKLIYLKSTLKCDSFDVAIDIKIQFFRVLVTIEPGRSLLQFVTMNCLKLFLKLNIYISVYTVKNKVRFKSRTMLCRSLGYNFLEGRHSSSGNMGI